MNDKEILLEQYKLYVEMADRISQRRTECNRFYVTLLTGLLAVMSIAFQGNWVNPDLQQPLMIFLSLLGLCLCVAWLLNITSYKQLNSGKFEVVAEMEAMLPFKCYDVEWDKLGRGKDWKKYFSLTRVERIVPGIIILAYMCLLIFSLFFW